MAHNGAIGAAVPPLKLAHQTRAAHYTTPVPSDASPPALGERDKPDVVKLIRRGKSKCETAKAKRNE